MNEIIYVDVPCKACGQTGKMFDIRTMRMERYLHCEGSGYETKEYASRCKYYGKPCESYFCKSCGDLFESEREYEMEED